MLFTNKYVNLLVSLTNIYQCCCCHNFSQSFFVHITAFCVDGFFGAAGDAVLGAIPINAVGDDAATGDGEGDGVGDDDDDDGDGEAYGDGDDEGGDGAGDGHDDYGDDGNGGAAGYGGTSYLVLFIWGGGLEVMIYLVMQFFTLMPIGPAARSFRMMSVSELELFERVVCPNNFARLCLEQRNCFVLLSV